MCDTLGKSTVVDDVQTLSTSYFKFIAVYAFLDVDTNCCIRVTGGRVYKFCPMCELHISCRSPGRGLRQHNYSKLFMISEPTVATFINHFKPILHYIRSDKDH